MKRFIAAAVLTLPLAIASLATEVSVASSNLENNAPRSAVAERKLDNGGGKDQDPPPKSCCYGCSTEPPWCQDEE